MGRSNRVINTNRRINEVLLGILSAFLTFIFSFFGIFGRLDYLLTDALYQRPVVLNNDIKIIAIDEKSMASLGAYTTWNRQYYADLLEVLYEDTDNAPKLCVFDMIFQGETDPLADQAFADAASCADGIVCAVNMVYKDAIETDENGKKFVNHFKPVLVEYPYDSLYEHAVVGFADSVQDAKDSYIRDFIPILSDETHDIPSLSLAAARVLKDRGLADINIPETTSGQSMMIRYSGEPGDYEAISFVDVLEGKIPPQAFKDSILFIGAYAPGMMDSFNVPTSHKSQMYGVEIHANLLESIINGRYMLRMNSLGYSLLYALIVFIFMLLAQNISLLASGIIGAIAIIIQMIIGVFLANNHRFLPLLVFPVFIILSYILVIILHYLRELMQRRRVLKAFRQYVAPEIVEKIAKQGNFELQLGGMKRDIAVLFVDIRGFTTLSESLPAEKVVEILNEYLNLTTTSIFNNLGTLDKFVGDATMAVFNSPFDLDDYVFRAVKAASDIVAGSEEIRRKSFELTGKEVSFGVGVNCGEAVVGNIGCDFRMDYTAIGDTVNTAARLEANAGAGQVLVSQMVVDRLGDRIKVKPVGEIPLKGKSIPLMVYELDKIIS